MLKGKQGKITITIRSTYSHFYKCSWAEVTDNLVVPLFGGSVWNSSVEQTNIFTTARQQMCMTESDILKLFCSVKKLHNKQMNKLCQHTMLSIYFHSSFTFTKCAMHFKFLFTTLPLTHPFGWFSISYFLYKYSFLLKFKTYICFTCIKYKYYSLKMLIRCYWWHSVAKCDIPSLPFHCSHNKTLLLFDSSTASSCRQFLTVPNVTN